MDIPKAKEIISALAQGINPVTGEILPRENWVNHPDIIRALHIAQTVLEKANKNAQRQAHQPENAGNEWKQEEDRKLLQLYDSGYTIAQLSEVHQRTRGSIRSRLSKLGRI